MHDAFPLVQELHDAFSLVHDCSSPASSLSFTTLVMHIVMIQVGSIVKLYLFFVKSLLVEALREFKSLFVKSLLVARFARTGDLRFFVVILHRFYPAVNAILAKC